ncbi:MAG: hypothetical protein JWN23_741 [Rhodocyclales bacterium]|nr:hypothetical protein [Rhodocyclales bacterium]
MKLLKNLRNLLCATSIASCLGICGCAFDRNSTTVTYVQPQGDVGMLTIIGPDRAQVFSHVEVCKSEGWRRAGVFGGGWKSIGGLTVAAGNELAANPKAVPLPNQLTFSLPVGQRVHFRVRSHPSYANGVVSECTVVASLVLRSGARYQSVWELGEKSCRLSLAEELQDATLRPIPRDQSEPSCNF